MPLAKVTFVKLIILIVRPQILFLLPTYGIIVIIKVKVFHRYFEVFPESNCKCLDFYPEAGGWLSPECFLVSPVLLRYARHWSLFKSLPFATVSTSSLPPAGALPLPCLVAFQTDKRDVIM